MILHNVNLTRANAAAKWYLDRSICMVTFTNQTTINHEVTATAIMLGHFELCECVVPAGLFAIQSKASAIIKTTNETSMPVRIILGRKCTMAALRAAPW